MNTKKQRAIKNLLFSALGQLITIAIGMILPRLFITSYGSETNGLLSTVNQFLMYLGLFEAGVGAATLQALYKPVAEDDHDAVNAVLSATHLYYKRAAGAYLISLIAFCGLYPLIVRTTLDYWTIFGVAFFSGIGNVILFFVREKYRLLMQAEGKSYIQTNLTTIMTVLTGLSKVVLIRLGFNVVVILVISFVIQMIQVVYTLIYIRRNYKWLALDVAPNHAAISQKNYALIHQISSLVFSNTDVLLLSVMCSLRVASVYSLYKMIVSHLENILAILSNSLGFDLGQTYQIDRQAYIRKIDLFESLYSIFAFALFSVTLSVIVPFMGVYTRGVEDINYCDRWLALLFVVISLLSAVRVPMQLTYGYAGHFKQTTRATIIETVINLVVSIVGCLLIGIYGVLLGTVVALTYRSLQIILYSNHHLLERGPWKTFAIHGTSLIALIAMQLLYAILNPAIYGYVDFFIVAGVDTVLTFVLMTLIHSALFPEVRSVILGVFRKTAGKLLRR